MSKRIIRIIAILTSMIMLAGCTSAGANSSQMVLVSAVGPNDLGASHFYRAVKDSTAYPHGAIAKMDVETAADTIIYEPENDRYIYEAIESGDGVLVALTKTQEVSKYSLIYLDENGESKSVLDSDQQMIFANEGDRVLVYDYSQQKYAFDPDTLELSPVETDEIEDEDLFTPNDALSIRRHFMDDGTEIVLRKNLMEESFTYEMGGNEYPIDCVSGEEFTELQWGAISDKDGVLYGIAAIPKSTADLRRMKMKVGLDGLRTDQVTKEMLFCVDVKSGNSQILYETDDARIVGYTDKAVYLLKKGAVYKKDLSSGNEELLGEVSKDSKAHLVFSWIGNKLFVFENGSGTLITTIQD